jgi:hypothetical protein
MLGGGGGSGGASEEGVWVGVCVCVCGCGWRTCRSLSCFFWYTLMMLYACPECKPLMLVAPEAHTSDPARMYLVSTLEI